MTENPGRVRRLLQGALVLVRASVLLAVLAGHAWFAYDLYIAEPRARREAALRLREAAAHQWI